MKALRWVCLCLALLATPLLGDTIYQTNSRGTEIVLQRDAIVVQQDSSFIVYKHFDLKERRVVVVRLNRGSLPMRVQGSNGRARTEILEVWKRFGYKAAITDAAGKVTHLYDLYLDFYPPAGRGSLLESIAPITNFPIQLDSGGPDEIEFGKIDHVAIQGDRLTITPREGNAVTGKFMMPTTQPAEVRVLGITDKYDVASPQVFDFSVPLSQLKLIAFE